MPGEQLTGTKDTTYDLSSVIYHALQGVETCQQYIQDAEQSGDNEVGQFMREAQQQQRQLAEKAKSLLKQRL